MTLPYEEKAAIDNTYKWLVKLCTSKIKDIKTREVKDMAIRLLRHYPSEFRTDVLFDTYKQ